MTLLTATTITKAGQAPAFVAIAASDTIDVNSGGGYLILQVKNTNASPNTVTLVDAGTTPGGSVATNPTVSIPATTGDKEIRIPREFADASGIVTVQHSNTTGGTCFLKRLA